MTFRSPFSRLFPDLLHYKGCINSIALLALSDKLPCPAGTHWEVAVERFSCPEQPQQQQLCTSTSWSGKVCFGVGHLPPTASLPELAEGSVPTV